MAPPSRQRRGGLLCALIVLLISPIAPQAIGSQRQEASHVVIAFVEHGINAYHADFRAASRLAPPSTWLPGYPAKSRPLNLHLHEKDFVTARAKDDSTWASIKPGQLYYLPGTRISGLVYLPSPLDRGASTSIDSNNPGSLTAPQRPVIDGYRFHGTGVASVAAGSRYGTCPDCDIVIVAAEDEVTGLAWAAQQPWVDIISNSWGVPAGVPTQGSPGHPSRAAQIASDNSRTAAANGHAVLFASGNGLTDLGPTTHGTQHGLTWDSPYAGPPWVLTIGASKAVTGQPSDWHNIPVDVIAQGEARPAANSDTLSTEMQFYGTSCSTPVAAGVIGQALLKARQRLRDRHVGPLHGVLLVAAATRERPAIRLTYLDLFRQAQAVATWRTFDPATLTQDPFLTPTTAVAFAYEGYGVLDRSSIASLANVLTGSATAPERPEMQSWTDRSRQIRTTIWGSSPVPQ